MTCFTKDPETLVAHVDSKARLYDCQNIDALVWPNNYDGQFAKKFLMPLLKNGITPYIKNINAQLFILKIEDFVFPITVVNESYTNSWVCSPYTHYISYGKEFSGIVGSSFLAGIVKNFMSFFGQIGRLGKINNVVYVNNWMFSTDLYPDGITEKHIKSIQELLIQYFPRHAVVFRSLNVKTTPHLIKSLTASNFYLIASRYVFVTNAKDNSIFQTRILKSDLRLWKKNPYTLITENEIKDKEYNQILELYENLYVQKHSSLQPQFKLNYFEHLLKNKLLKFRILKLEDQIKGVAGFYTRGNVMMCPVFGYKKDSEESNTVYRLLNTALLLEAQKEGLVFNQSAGAAFFKSIRRAEGCLEYMAVYPHHLPTLQKHIWKILKLFINKLGSKYMENY